jgi:hypothetical protein
MIGFFSLGIFCAPYEFLTIVCLGLSHRISKCSYPCSQASGVDDSIVGIAQQGAGEWLATKARNLQFDLEICLRWQIPARSIRQSRSDAGTPGSDKSDNIQAVRAPAADA